MDVFFKSDFSIVFKPHRLTQSIDWHGHLSFAAWLVEYFAPQTIVELGVFRGDSLSTFAQSNQELHRNAKIFGIDKWLGDSTTGIYGEEVYADVKDYFTLNYPDVRLIREFFDDAIGYFVDGSIDLLHIDGCHEYDAVKHDYELWKPKMSEKGVILFHDVTAYEPQFGVHQFWGEIQEQFPSFAFEHSNGLGVLFVGDSIQDEARCIVENSSALAVLKSVFALSGERFVYEAKMKYWRQVAEKHAAELYRLQQIPRIEKEFSWKKCMISWLQK